MEACWSYFWTAPCIIFSFYSTMCSIFHSVCPELQNLVKDSKFFTKDFNGVFSLQMFLTFRYFGFDVCWIISYPWILFIYLYLLSPFSWVWGDVCLGFQNCFWLQIFGKPKIGQRKHVCFRFEKLFSKKIRSFKDSFWTTINRRFGVFLKTRKTS